MLASTRPTNAKATNAADRFRDSRGKTRDQWHDEALRWRGLQLWVQPSGAKLWNLAYRMDAKQRKLAIGPYPRVSLKEARERREEAKRLLASGLDPSQQKRIEKANRSTLLANTFSTIADELLAKKRREGKAEATMNKLDWLVGLMRPFLGTRPIAEIGAPEILAALRVVEKRGKLETARRLRAVTGEIFRYAVVTGRASADPTGALKGALTIPQVQHRAAIIDPTTLGELLRAIDGYFGMPEVRFALQMLALTFARPGELRFARWEEIDFEKATWTIPGPRMKMRRPHRVPLAPQSISVLQSVGEFTGHRQLIFPGARSPLQPLSENTFNATLRRLGYAKGEMTSHGFRAAASSILNESGEWNADAIEVQLAHVENNAVRRAYARAQYWDERVRMMDWWANKLDSLRRGGEVIPLAMAR